MILNRKLPVVTIGNMIPLPHTSLSVNLVKETSVNAANNAVDDLIILIAQKEEAHGTIRASHLYDVGVVCQITAAISVSAKTNAHICVKGLQRVRITEWFESRFYLEAKYEAIEDECSEENEQEIEANIRTLLDLVQDLKDSPYKVNVDFFKLIENLSPRAILYTVTQYIDRKIIKNTIKQRILEEPDLMKQMRMLLEIIQTELNILKRQEQIKGDVKEAINRAQREMIKNQIQAMQAELDDESDECKKFEERFKLLALSPAAKKQVEAEIKKLRNLLHPPSAEAHVSRNYLEIMASLPWGKTSQLNVKQLEAAEILNKYHYGLEEVKESILRFVALQARIGYLPNIALCLFGPPGIGKTTLADAVARATGRKLVTISLAGVKDEAEIRGHRRTYVGAMVGRIMAGVMAAGEDNPVILLDEVGSMRDDVANSNPMQALRELLDPGQNHSFVDHFLDVPYDLSKAIFILTTNSLENIPLAVRDRVDIIHMHGYTSDEKLSIAKSYIIPKMKKLYQLSDTDLTIEDTTVEEIIHLYTKEAGVRDLDRKLKDVGMWAVKKIQDNVEQDQKSETALHITATPGILYECLGIPIYPNTKSSIPDKDMIGMANGLAWTSVGGESCPVQVRLSKGTGKLSITGNIGKVMKESVQMILGLIKVDAHKYGIPLSMFTNCDAHLHFPEAAVPKDGPSAGVTIFSAFLSAFTGLPINHKVAMTGEVNLLGQVLRIGGVREKLLAALREGMKTVLLPAENSVDLQKLPTAITGLEIKLCNTVEDIVNGVFSDEYKQIIQQRIYAQDEYKYVIQEDTHAEDIKKVDISSLSDISTTISSNDVADLDDFDEA